MATILHEQIEKRSYMIWEQAGKPDDQALDHWLQAEKELAALFPTRAKPVEAAALKPNARAKKAATPKSKTTKAKAARP